MCKVFDSTGSIFVLALNFYILYKALPGFLEGRKIRKIIKKEKQKKREFQTVSD